MTRQCPNCNQGYLKEKKAGNNGQDEDTLNCSNCPSFYPWYYFRVFRQFNKVEETEWLK